MLLARVKFLCLTQTLFELNAARRSYVAPGLSLALRTPVVACSFVGVHSSLMCAFMQAERNVTRVSEKPVYTM
jgi:hypothetical protein